MSTNEVDTELKVHIRWCITADMPAVVDIEADCFEFPWKHDDFVRCFRQRNCIGMVATRGRGILGFMVYELHKSRLHILNFAVAPEFRRRGVGSQMTAKLISKLSAQRRTRITLEVRESNVAAQLFFRSQGFEATGILRDFYDDSDESAYIMQYKLTEAPDA